MLVFLSYLQAMSGLMKINVNGCRERDSNPHNRFWSRDFKSLVSTIPPSRPMIFQPFKALGFWFCAAKLDKRYETAKLLMLLSVISAFVENYFTPLDRNFLLFVVQKSRFVEHFSTGAFVGSGFS